MHSFLPVFFPVLLSATLMVSSYFIALIQIEKGFEFKDIYGPFSGIVILAIGTWIFYKMNQAKDKRLQDMQDKMLEDKDKQIEEKDRQIRDLQNKIRN